jgi:hypothetical protein
VAGEDDDDGNAASSTQAVTADQAATIEALLAETQVDRARFLKFMHAPSVAEIRAKDFDAAVEALKAKRRG